MILRLWRGWTTADLADAYDDVLHNDVAPGILAKRLDGLRSFDVWRRLPSEQDGEHEFLTAMRFEDMAAVERFAGGPTQSYVPQQAQSVLARFDDHSQHYELRHRHL